MRTPKEVFAVAHIEKAAGTTFVEILRRNFLFRFAEVRPFYEASGTSFLDDDLRLQMRLNPFTRIISGHAIKPFNHIGGSRFSLKYISILRDPCKRYVSQYMYWRNRMGIDISFPDFLKIPELHNFHVRKIAGTGDAEAAISSIDEQFLLVGLAEEFDKFLLLLSALLKDELPDIRYRIKNMSHKQDEAAELETRYADTIRANNEQDQTLYDHVRNQLMPEYIRNYGKSFLADLDACQERNKGYTDTGSVARYGYQVYKKFYMVPVTGLLRLSHGMPFRGSYGKHHPGKIWDGMER